MKRVMLAAGAATVCVLLGGCTASVVAKTVGAVVCGIIAALFFLLAGIRTYSVIRYRRRRKKQRKPQKNQLLLTIALYAIGVLFLLFAILFLLVFQTEAKKPAAEPETEPTVPVVTEPPVVYIPQKTAESDPENWGIRWEILDGDAVLPVYQRPDEMFFEETQNYAGFDGIATFRGNNYRSDPVCGTVTLAEKTIQQAWSAQTGVLPGSNWSGSGWTGQPLLAKWDAQTKQNMNLYPEKQAKADLIEVIYATLDGNIYFLDLADGSYTRDPLQIGMCFKGAGSLDPRGYPILYVGSGDTNGENARPRMFIISLVDGSILYEYGHSDTRALRKDNDAWCAFDSSPLIHGQTDTLIWPGENGILYTMKLNTRYDPEAGTLSVSPGEMICTRYHTERSTKESYWYGYEASASMVENYLYVSENGGMFYCIDINTMELVWAQDTGDDSNSSPVFQPKGDDGGYIYTAPSLHWTKDEERKGTIHIFKLDAISGEIIWKVPYDVYTVEGVSGGVQATPALGRPGTDMEDMIIYPVARTPDEGTGILVALNTQTGEEIWRKVMDYYAWSSPVAVYTQDGKGYLVAFDSIGKGYLMDGATGEILDTINMGGFVEASAAVYDNMLVIGTRNKTIQGLKLN